MSFQSIKKESRADRDREEIPSGNKAQTNKCFQAHRVASNSSESMVSSLYGVTKFRWLWHMWLVTLLILCLKERFVKIVS